MRESIINLGFYSLEKQIYRTNGQKQETIPNVRKLYHEKFPLQFLFPFLRNQQVAPQFG